jgi:hypothetical protein
MRPTADRRYKGTIASEKTHLTTKQVIMATEPFKGRGGIKPHRKTRKFGFDHDVFSPQKDQLDV